METTKRTSIRYISRCGVAFICLLHLWPRAQATGRGDSVRVIDEVTVRSDIRYHETIQPQVISSETLERINAKTVADALRVMAGVQLKDYGGIGGLKTVNLRSLGSHHVGIHYDGIELGNAQNGVIDLGQFSLDNVVEVALCHGQRSAILQSASDFVNAGSIYIKTLNPLLASQQVSRLKAQLGSSQTVRLSALYSHKLTPHLGLNLNVEGLASSGRYPFTYRRRRLDGSLAYDTTAIRQNGDIQSLRAEANVYGLLAQGQWQAKAYAFASNRGIPGAIVNNVWRRGERQSDVNMLVQASWQRDVTERYTLRALAKYAHYRTHYLNKDTTVFQADNTYRQHEAYLSLAQVVELRPWWSLSLTYDARLNLLDANLPRFAEPRRLTHMGAVATALDLSRLQLQGSLVGTWAQDHVQLGQSAGSTHHLTPALFASLQLTPHLQLNAFAKQSFRMPTFNDLYYTEIGNAALRPETAIQYDAGVRWERLYASQLHLRAVLEAYYNTVHDKIVAYPKGQQFRWTMLNIGRVHIQGVELRTEAEWTFRRDWSLQTLLQYTYQQAIDVTDPNTSFYKHQIPYTPWHSGSVTAMLSHAGWDLAYNWTYTGQRYSQQENIAYNHVEPWYTSDLHLAYRTSRHRLMLEVNNLLDQQYDVIINYPMPGRNYNLSWQYEF